MAFNNKKQYLKSRKIFVKELLVNYKYNSNLTL